MTDYEQSRDPQAEQDGLTITPVYDLDRYIEEFGNVPGVWGGRGAAALGLSGPVDPRAAADVLTAVSGGELDPEQIRQLATHAPTAHDRRMTIPPPDPDAPQAIGPDGHVDPAAAARWHKAQTELVGLIREENQIIAQDPAAEPLLPDELAPWMASRVAELEQEESEAEI
jgi:hypothetical protein